MIEQVTALIKFQTCDLARDLATATSAYDSAEATAWVVPFTQAQQAYWAEQAYWNEGIWTEPFNGYAADYATQRTNAITNTANSAYENCMAGGATSPSLSAAAARVSAAQVDFDAANTALAEANNKLAQAQANLVAVQNNAGGTVVSGDGGVIIPSSNTDALNAAQRAVDEALAGVQSATDAVTAATLALADAAKPRFQAVVQSQLSGHAATGSSVSATAGLFTQLNIAFAPAQVLSPLDWRAFYRLGTVHINFNFIENWLMSFPAGGGYTQQVYTTLPMRPSIQVEASNLVSVAADFAPYIDVPDGQFIEVPADMTADFTAIQSSFAFTVYRFVYLPDGQVIEMHVDWLDQTTGALSDQRATVEFPELGATCDESGTVDVYHFITAYALGTLYKLSDPVQRVKNQYGVYDFEVPAATFGTTPPSYGPPGYLSLHESFYYQAELQELDFNAFGIAMLYVTHNGVIYARAVYLVWKGRAMSSHLLQGYTSNMPLPVVSAYTPPGSLPTTFSVTFSKPGVTPVTLSLSVVETAYVASNIEVSADTWLMGSSPTCGSKLTPPTGTVRTSWQSAYDAVPAKRAAAIAAAIAAYPVGTDRNIAINTANVIYNAEMAALYAAWDSWLVTGGTALADLTTSSTHVHSNPTDRGSQIIRHNIVAPTAMTSANLSETHTGTGPWAFGDILPDFY